MKSLKYFSAIGTFIVVLMVFVSYTGTLDSDPSESKTDPVETDRLPQIIRSVNLDKVYEFAGEQVPMDNFDVVERLDRELLVNSYWHSSTALNIKNSSRYFPVIEAILAEEGVPDDFKYLAVIESNLRNASSPAGAKGIWQFMKSSGQYYGLEINGEVDERYHLEKSTKAACKHLKDSYNRFKSWSLAAAAYNMGDTRLRKELEYQKEKSYYNLNLSEETMRYLFRILAVKEIISDPEAFGFEITSDEKYKPMDDYRILEVTTGISNLGAFAKENGTTYRMLKLYNPWLRTYRLSNKSGKRYEIKIPN